MDTEPSPVHCDHGIPLSQKCDACEPPRRHTCDQHVGCAATHAIGASPFEARLREAHESIAHRLEVAAERVRAAGVSVPEIFACSCDVANLACELDVMGNDVHDRNVGLRVAAEATAYATDEAPE